MAKLLSLCKKAEGEAIGRVEAPRGECMHYVRMAGKEAPESWKIKASSYSNLMSWIPMLQGEQMADIPIIVASIDPCLSCTDRVAVVRGRKVRYPHQGGSDQALAGEDAEAAAMTPFIIIGAVLVVVFGIVVGLFLMGFDRIVAARMQARIGPPLTQPFTDIRKLFAKENVVPENAIPWLFNYRTDPRPCIGYHYLTLPSGRGLCSGPVPGW